MANKQAKLLKVKLIYLDKSNKDGTKKWKESLTILKDNGTDKWVKIVFGEQVNEKLFKNENQILYVLPDKIEPHTFGFKSWQDKDGKWHNPYIRINQVEKFEKAPTISKKVNEPTINQDLFVVDESETESVEIVESPDLPFNDED